MQKGSAPAGTIHHFWFFPGMEEAKAATHHQFITHPW